MFRIFFLLACCTAAWTQNAAVNQTVGPNPVAEKKPLSEALGEIGWRVRDGFTSFGIVVSDPEPIVEVYWPQATNLMDAVQRIISQAPGYTYEVISAHLIDVYPYSLRADPNFSLNVRVLDIHLTDVSAIELFSNPMRYIPELKTFEQKDYPQRQQACGGIGPGLGYIGTTPIEINLHDSSVKQILDAAAIADAATRELAATRKLPPAGWVLRSHVDSATGKRKDIWSHQVTVPHAWRDLLIRDQP